ncbi:diguanylate cyclase [bacterium]|nr:diguanylate cyclase [bacterium]
MAYDSALIVGGSESIRGLLKSCFTRAGDTCEAVPTADAALEVIGNSSFDFILIDTILMGVEWLELTEMIKRAQPEAAVIILTDADEQFSYDTAMEAGADDFLKKPFTTAEVLARIKIVRVRQNLYRWAIIDELTDVYNRKGFFTLAEHQLKIAKRTKEAMFMLYVDLDDLKVINDEHGHKEGDLVLAKAAEILKENFRESDIVARIGGDEFVVFPIRTTKSNQGIIVERFEKAIVRYNEVSKKPYKLTMSFGISSYDPDSASSLDELLIEADKAMYRMKMGEDG